MSPRSSKSGFLAILILLSAISCEQNTEPDPEPPTEPVDLTAFPDFFTPNQDYFVTRIGDIPQIDPDTYRLAIHGALASPCTLSLADLHDLDLVEIPLTVECIGNPENAPLVSTAKWKGFDLYQLLVEKGLSSSAVAVQYRCADGYYASHSMDQLENDGVLAALYMNGDTIPPVQGFPLRILIPGYYGVKQPAWVTEIEVLTFDGDDFWDYFNWDTSPPMPVDSKILFPENYSRYSPGDSIRIGGTAFGGGQPASVELSYDFGETWVEAEIIYGIDVDHVWVFWTATLVLEEEGQYAIYARATDMDGHTQPQEDHNYRDGNDQWPLLRITIGD